MMLTSRRLAVLSATALCLLAPWSGRGQSASPAGGADLTQIYNQGMAEFQAGNFAKAATDLEGLLAKAGFSPQLEPVFYTVGSAWFNAGDYGKALAAFKTYQTKFPQGPRVLDVAFGTAQANLANKNYLEAAAQFAALERDPRFRAQALLLQATALRDGGKIDEAIGVLEKATAGEWKNGTDVRAAM